MDFAALKTMLYESIHTIKVDLEGLAGAVLAIFVVKFH